MPEAAYLLLTPNRTPRSIIYFPSVSLSVSLRTSTSKCSFLQRPTLQRHPGCSWRWPHPPLPQRERAPNASARAPICVLGAGRGQIRRESRRSRFGPLDGFCVRTGRGKLTFGAPVLIRLVVTTGRRRRTRRTDVHIRGPESGINDFPDVHHYSPNANVDLASLSPVLHDRYLG